MYTIKASARKPAIVLVCDMSLRADKRNALKDRGELGSQDKRAEHDNKGEKRDAENFHLKALYSDKLL